MVHIDLLLLYICIYKYGWTIMAVLLILALKYDIYM